MTNAAVESIMIYGEKTDIHKKLLDFWLKKFRRLCESAKFFVLQKIKRSDRKIKCAGQRLINLTAHFIFISRNVFRSGRTR